MGKLFASIGIAGLLAVLVGLSAGTLFRTGGRAARISITVYGFSIMGEVLREEIFPRFREKWLAERGIAVDFVDSYAGSGTVANQIVYGAPADVAILSHPADADRIVACGASKRGWRGQPHGGYVNRTPWAIVVRPGNPKGIRDFSDLGRPDIRIVHPDPLTSGGARWAILAEYGAPLVRAKSEGVPQRPDLAFEQLRSIWHNVVAQAPSARAALGQFNAGFGDALITYEVEILFDTAHGRALEAVLPPVTIASEHPVVIVDRNVEAAEREAVEAFVDFLWTEPAQRAFVRFGFRSATDSRLDALNPRFGKVLHMFTSDDLGGLVKVEAEIVEGIWKGRVLPELKR